MSWKTGEPTARHSLPVTTTFPGKGLDINCSSSDTHKGYIVSTIVSASYNRLFKQYNKSLYVFMYLDLKWYKLCLYNNVFYFI